VSFCQTAPLCRLTFEHVVINRPRLLPSPPGHYLDLNAILLNVNAGREEQPAFRNGPDPVVLAPVVQPLPFGGVTLQCPGLAENGVHEYLE